MTVTRATMSAETSGGEGYPRCTPPIPPVPRNLMPTPRATASTPPTVVAPTSPATAQAARSRGPHLRASGTKRASSSSVRPTWIRPSSTPIVAGTAPASRIARSLARPTSTPVGAGKPCATRVVSSATTGRPSSSAARTSSESRMSSFTPHPHERIPRAREAGSLVEADALVTRPDDQKLNVLLRCP